MLTLITGASSNHFKTLLNFLIRNEPFIKPYRVVVYDLGLTEKENQVLTKNFPQYLHCKFDYSKYPDYFNIKIEAGQYAWKPVIIHEVAAKFGGYICWMDSGNLIYEDLRVLINVIKTHKIYTPRSSMHLKRWVHPGTLKYLNYIGNLFLRNRSGGYFACDYSLKFVKDFVNDWKNGALIKECIAPEGSHRKNHRQDQAVLSVLFHQYQKKYKFPIKESIKCVTFYNDIK